MVGEVHLLDKLLCLFQHLLRVFSREEIGNDIVSDETTAGSVGAAGTTEQGLAHPSFRNLATASSSSMGILGVGLEGCRMSGMYTESRETQSPLT